MHMGVKCCVQEPSEREEGTQTAGDGFFMVDDARSISAAYCDCRRKESRSKLWRQVSTCYDATMAAMAALEGDMLFVLRSELPTLVKLLTSVTPGAVT